MLPVHCKTDGRSAGRRAGLKVIAAAVAAGGLLIGVGASLAAAAPEVAASAATPNPQFQFSAEPYTTHGAQQRADFSYELQPGHRILDQFVVLNASNADEHFLIYGEDASNVPATGGYAFEQRAQMHNTTVGQWLTVGTTVLTVPAGKEVVETFQLSIPANAPPGDHLGGVVIEQLKTAAQQKQPVGVNQVLRIAIPMYVRVVGKSYPGLTIENLKVFHQSPAIPYLTGTPKVAVSFDLVNTGNVIIDPRSVTVSIKGELSGTIHKYTVHQTGAAQSRTNPLPLQMLLGAKLTLTEEWSGIPPFDPLTAHVSATAIDASSARSFSTAASTSFWYFPWIVVLIVLAVIAGVITFLVMRRRRKAAAGGPPPGRGGESGGGGPPPSPSRSDRETLEEAGI
jgi:hypothetical protein